MIHGRSDTTLKPGGVRIGTAEVYRFAETVEEVQDSLVIGDQIKVRTHTHVSLSRTHTSHTRSASRYKVGKRKGDVRIVLFVKLAPGTELNADIEKAIRTACEGGSDAHVPALIKQVNAILYTRSGKKVELAVKSLFDGMEPKNVGRAAGSERL